MSESSPHAHEPDISSTVRIASLAIDIVNRLGGPEKQQIETHPFIAPGCITAHFPTTETMRVFKDALDYATDKRTHARSLLNGQATIIDAHSDPFSNGNQEVEL